MCATNDRINGVSTRRGLQSWGDTATNIGPIHVGYHGDCSSPDRPTPRQRRDARPRGPVHSCEERATSPGFREVRYLDRDLTRQGAGTATYTPGPGQYNIRVPLQRGTTFAGPRPKSSKIITVRAFIASAKTVASTERAGQAERGSGVGQRVWPSPPPVQSQRLSVPLMGRESPGPAYNLPSDFDQKLVNKKTFHPPRCDGKKTERQVARGRGRRITCREGRRTSLPQARRALADVAANAGGRIAGIALGVPVTTSLGRGFLLRIRADGMTFVRFPWGVLYTMEVLTRGNVAPAALEDPAVSNSESGGMARDTTPSEEGRCKDTRDVPQPTGGA